LQDWLAPLNDISELLYIVDLETYDLLFINETGMKIFEVDSIYGKNVIKSYKEEMRLVILY